MFPKYWLSQLLHVWIKLLLFLLPPSQKFKLLLYFIPDQLFSFESTNPRPMLV